MIKIARNDFIDFPGKRFLDRVVVTADYNDEILQRAIHCLKYQFATDVAEELVSLVSADKIPLSWKHCVLLPIPLHKKRERLRGFNQAELIAIFLSERFGLYYRNDILSRIKYRVPQMSLGRSERLKNIKDIFFVDKDNLCGIKNVVLVDDVVTTGATLNEAAEVLKKNGVENVEAIVLGHG
jgi:predicted amidophosphoribosyltransferase